MCNAFGTGSFKRRDPAKDTVTVGPDDDMAGRGAANDRSRDAERCAIITGFFDQKRQRDFAGPD